MRNFNIIKAIKSPQFIILMTVLVITALLMLLNSCEPTTDMSKQDVQELIDNAVNTHKNANDSVNATQDTLLAFLNRRDSMVMMYAFNCMKQINIRIDSLFAAEPELTEPPEWIDSLFILTEWEGVKYKVEGLVKIRE